MTAFTTQTLVANVVYGVPSGNYDGSSQDWLSNAVPAASYYAGQGSIQTITYQLNNFVGLIKIEATLNDAQESAPWFEIANIGNISNELLDEILEVTNELFSRHQITALMKTLFKKKQQK